MKKIIITTLVIFISVLAIAQPANDCCTSATVLTVDASMCVATLGTNVNATDCMEGTPTCASYGGGDTWYEVTVPASGELIVELDAGDGTVSDMGMSWYTGTCGSLVQSECDDDDGNGLFPLIQQSGLTPGDVIYVQVWEFGNNVFGDYNICTYEPPPPPMPPANDMCADAIAVPVNADFACGTVVNGTIEGATDSGTDAPPEDNTICLGTEDDDVWFSFVATSTDHQIDLTNITGSTTDLYHSVWEGSCGALTNIICSDPNSSTLTGLTVGTTYYVRVYSWTSTPDQDSVFDICIGTEPPPPTCADGSNPVAYCYDSSLTDEVAYEFCPTNPGETVTVDILQGTLEGNFDDVTYYSGAAGSGSGGTILAGPVDGNQTNTSVTSNPDECVIIVINSDGSVSCVSGSQDEMLACATINSTACTAAASTISTLDPTRICVDGVGDPINVTVDVDGGATGVWVITDAAGIILDFPPGPPFDLDGAGAGQCLIWYVNVDDPAFMPMIGDDAAAAIAASSCAFLSNPITVDRIEVTGAVISTADATTICVDDGVDEPINVAIDDAGIGANGAWVITDAAGTIVGLPAAPPFILDGAGTGSCSIWWVNYDDPAFAPMMGDDAAAIVAAATCAALSNPITIIRENCGVCEDEIVYTVSALGCDMTGATIELQDAAGASIASMPLGQDGGIGTFGLQPCGMYQVFITGAPACYTDAGGDVGPRTFTTVGAGTVSQTFIVGGPTDIPTLSEWGLITLALLLMSFGSVKMAVGNVALTGVGNKSIPMPGGNGFKLPFDVAILRKALAFTAIVALIGFAICFAMYGTLFMSDIIGVLIAGPVFAYLAHLLYILETRREK